MMLDKNINVDYLISNREIFNRFIYTPQTDIVPTLLERETDSNLNKYIKDSLPGGVPPILLQRKYALLSRDVATPNYETKRFISMIDGLDNFSPLFWEYGEDRFTPNVNMSKFCLGKMTFYFGLDKRGCEKIRRINIIDFNLYNGKKISNIKTIWGQNLIDFHHELIMKNPSDLSSYEPAFFDASEWYSRFDGGVRGYYKKKLTLFLKHSVLFEDFMLEDVNEVLFIRDVFLPAFIGIFKETGLKPLIISLAPTEIESSHFWTYYPQNSIEFIKNKLKMV